MAIDEDPFPPVASINTASFDLRALIESKKAGKLSSIKVWVPKYCLVHVDKLKKLVVYNVYRSSIKDKFSEGDTVGKIAA